MTETRSTRRRLILEAEPRNIRRRLSPEMLASVRSPEPGVGYKNPPIATRFKPGQSGNRKGRPKGALNMNTVVNKQLEAQVTVTENGRQKRVRKKEVIAMQLVNKAVTGDLKATSMLLRESRDSEAATQAAQTGIADRGEEFMPEEKKVIASILERWQQLQAPDESQQ